MAVVDRALWQQIVQHVATSGGNLIRPWFSALEPISLEHGLLEIQVPGTRERKYCQRNATRLFTEAAQATTGRLVGVCFLTNADGLAATDSPPVAVAEEDHSATDTTFLNEENTFETFVNGPCNRLAHAACMAVSESPGKAYNPLFIHGNVGLGKTHLLQATCHKLDQALDGARVCYLSCETFVNHFIQAVEQGRLHDFRYQYRHADLLVIDDIQFLSGHEQTQEEFFHTFNTLYQSQKQIILSSDRSPTQIADLEDRLISRFNWGLVAQIGQPCYETRVAIVRKKARLRQVAVPEDAVCFIAGSIDTNTRELEGAISKIDMLAKVRECPINLALAEEALGAEPVPSRREITVEDILNVVTARYSVRLADLQSKRRSRSIAFPRQICMYLARNLTRHSLEEIGGYFGGRDHTTVLHAYKIVEKRRKEDAQFQATLDLLTQQIQAGT